jgi:hypothetical protein
LAGGTMTGPLIVNAALTVAPPVITGNGTAVTITGGGTSTNDFAGAVTITGGASTVSGSVGGQVQIVGGSGTSGGSAALRGGSASETVGGIVSLTGGTSTLVGGIGGHVQIMSGANTTAGGKSGDVQLIPGPTALAPGSVRIAYLPVAAPADGATTGSDIVWNNAGVLNIGAGPGLLPAAIDDAAAAAAGVALYGWYQNAGAMRQRIV